MSVLIAVHILAAVVWVGGMFFALMALRPATAELEPPVRLGLWRRTLGRFLAWVWAAIAALLLSGYAMVLFELGGFAAVGLHVHLMQATGLVMILLFLHLWFAPWARLKRLLEAGDVPGAGAELNRIRQIVTVNLVLGLITVVLGAAGRYWG
ncbi:MAG: CopD family protein [Alphaproteobacteria bacterium]|jgi:uncharacterized membrane protein|nr:CopD family protein [Alphaproteobacteria bacterium]